MTKRYLLIVAEGCGGCEQAKKVVADYNVPVIDVTKSLYGADIMRQSGIFKVPLLIEIDDSKDQACIMEKGLKVACIKESTLTRDSA